MRQRGAHLDGLRPREEAQRARHRQVPARGPVGLRGGRRLAAVSEEIPLPPAGRAGAERRAQIPAARHPRRRNPQERGRHLHSPVCAQEHRRQGARPRAGATADDATSQRRAADARGVCVGDEPDGDGHARAGGAQRPRRLASDRSGHVPVRQAGWRVPVRVGGRLGRAGSNRERALPASARLCGAARRGGRYRRQRARRELRGPTAGRRGLPRVRGDRLAVPDGDGGQGAGRQAGRDALPVRGREVRAAGAPCRDRAPRRDRAAPRGRAATAAH